MKQPEKNLFNSSTAQIAYNTYCQSQHRLTSIKAKFSSGKSTVTRGNKTAWASHEILYLSRIFADRSSSDSLENSNFDAKTVIIYNILKIHISKSTVAAVFNCCRHLQVMDTNYDVCWKCLVLTVRHLELIIMINGK
jgi:hypothetical protein